MSAPLWNGFRYRWRKTSHRLSYLGSRFQDGGHQLTLKIGTFPKDRADYRVWATTLGGADAPFVGRGSQSFRLSSRIGRAGSANATVDLPAHFRQEAPDPAGVLGVAVVGGFQIQSVGNTSGWHFGRLAVELGPLREEDGQLRFELSVALRPSESPEIIHLGNKGWSYDQDCIYDVTIDWVVVLSAPGRLAVVRSDWKPQILSSVADVRKEELSLTVPTGGAERCTCAVAFERLDVRVGSTDAQRRRTRMLRYMEGRNIREIGVWIELLGHDVTSGVTRIQPAVTFSNVPRGSWLLRIGVLAVILALCVLAALAGATVSGAGFAGIALAIAVLAVRWPGGPLVFPAVPWRLDADLGCVVLGMRGDVQVDTALIESLHDVVVAPHLSSVDLDAARRPRGWRDSSLMRSVTDADIARAAARDDPPAEEP